jgi:hypothetical protein
LSVFANQKNENPKTPSQLDKKTSISWPQKYNN